MNLYLLSQSENRGGDTYDSIVVCAENEEDAKSISPNGGPFVEKDIFSGWAQKKSSITCEEIGKANKDVERGIIIASFNAG